MKLNKKLTNENPGLDTVPEVNKNCCCEDDVLSTTVPVMVSTVWVIADLGTVVKY